ncbi:MAG: acetyl-CoA carboxylase carboxyltransferase subunit beta [bacterium]|nr:acetyl-CoA carboxylase carboxyltransferase subunit beta [bacterium]
MAWFRKKKKFTPIGAQKTDLPEGVWAKCPSCAEYVTNDDIRRNLHRCPKCDHYSVFPIEERIQHTLDDGSFEEFDSNLASKNPLDFDGYDKKLQSAKQKTGRHEACVAGRGTIHGYPVIFAALDFSFMGGSMGSVVGEKITRCAERAVNDELPLVVISTGGGGARMHEGTLSLMQMAKTSAAIGRMKQHGVPFISVIAHPTMGGVAASFAALGDVIIAEPGALIGFAGPRVIEQTIGQQLPKGFQRAEFLLDHGMIDMIIERPQVRETLKPLIHHMWYARIAARNEQRDQTGLSIAGRTA